MALALEHVGSVHDKAPQDLLIREFLWTSPALTALHRYLDFGCLIDLFVISAEIRPAMAPEAPADTAGPSSPPPQLPEGW